MPLFKLKDIKNEIKKLKKRSAAGPDNIHNLMLINASTEFLNLLLQLFNNSVQTSTIPSSWKIAIVTMIPKKKNNSSNPKDYRPISVSSCLGKLLEKLLRTRINNFLSQKNILLKQQSGFRSQRQTRDNLSHLLQKTIESFNRRKKVCSIFFDIAAAFDKVWHQGLLNKMIKMNFPRYIIKWISELLKDRKFKVTIGEASSALLSILAGVPQGVVLSPIL